MQAPDGSSPGARSALMAFAIDLKVPPIVMARALEVAFDNLRIFPNASRALCCAIAKEGYYVDAQIMDVALQRLRMKFGGIFHHVWRRSTTNACSDPWYPSHAARVSETVVHTALWFGIPSDTTCCNDDTDPSRYFSCSNSFSTHCEAQ